MLSIDPHPLPTDPSGAASRRLRRHRGVTQQPVRLSLRLDQRMGSPQFHREQPLVLNRYPVHLLGLDHTKLTHRYAGRDFRLTNVSGEVARAVIA